ncbi:hypothetical protein [Ottowia thiooxydans]|uniref:hypothetical protein n=1 Tax=Ottowia thiooxydans TaxID=219182 RepID=UPI0004901FF9|nr:hypothetical protein [Ottowia thiooxydans]
MTTDLTTLLEAAPNQHSHRCVLAQNAIVGERWPAAACNLRTTATLAQEWADQARTLADWCDTQAESGRIHSRALPPSKPSSALVELEPAGPATLEALEAGLMAMAHSVGREHAMRVRRAINGVLAAQPPTQSTPCGLAV